MSSPFECPVCYEEYSESFLPTTLKCGHSLCKSHLKELTNKKCPICMTSFSPVLDVYKTTFSLLEASVQAKTNKEKRKSSTSSTSSSNPSLQKGKKEEKDSKELTDTWNLYHLSPNPNPLPLRSRGLKARLHQRGVICTREPGTYQGLGLGLGSPLEINDQTGLGSGLGLRDRQAQSGQQGGSNDSPYFLLESRGLKARLLHGEKSLYSLNKRSLNANNNDSGSTPLNLYSSSTSSSRSALQYRITHNGIIEVTAPEQNTITSALRYRITHNGNIEVPTPNQNTINMTTTTTTTYIPSQTIEGRLKMTGILNK